MDRENKTCSCSRKSGLRKNNAGTDKEEEKKLAGPMAKKELPPEECSTRNGKREEGSRQKKISDDRQYHDKWTVCRYEKEDCEEGRVENADFAVKDLDLREVDCDSIDWITLAEDRDLWKAYIRAVMNLRVP